MNDKFEDMHRDDENIARKLDRAAQQIEIDPHFAAELEQKLKDTHQPKVSRLAVSIQQVTPTLRWVALLILLGLVLSWSIRTLVPATQPAGGSTPDEFVCPVTEPNGSLPPGTQTSEGTSNYGNGELWTILPPDGKVHIPGAIARQSQTVSGGLEIPWPWWKKNTEEALTVDGHRLDAQANPLIDGMSDRFNNFLSASLIFPSTGCWEVTGRAGKESLTFVMEIVIDNATPTPAQGTPVVSVNGSETPVPPESGYDFRGGKLYLAQPLPESPAQASVYLLKKDQQVTADEARALVDRFGLGGETYTAYDYVFSVNDFYFTDGKQALEVYSNRRFTYTADLAKSSKSFKFAPVNNAETIIGDFLTAHGFDFPFKITATEFFGGYSVQPLTPDGLPMQYESFTFPPMLIKLDENGNVLSLDASLMDFDPKPLGTFGIITAQEALDKLLNDNEKGGKSEFFHSAQNQPPQEWYRTYPDNQTVTIQGYVSSNLPVDSSQSPFIAIDGVPAIGNTDGLEKLERATFVEATGQYILGNDVRKFKVDSWKSDIEQAYITGSLHKDGDQIILTSDDGSGKQYPLIEPPADLPLDTKIPDSQLAVSGVIVNGNIDWYYIQYFENMSHSGGGGGGGLGFYQLNLSGTPVPFLIETPTLIPNPTAPSGNQGTVQYTVKEGDTLLSIAQAFWTTPDRIMQVNGFSSGDVLMPGMTIIIPDIPDTIANLAPLGKRIEGLRGNISITIYKKPDGSQRTEYTLVYIPTDKQYSYMSFQMILEGKDLQALQAYQNRPIEIWGTISGYDKHALLPIVTVERFNIPFPDLNFQILKGRQRAATVNGQEVILFTTEGGITYVQSDGVGEVYCCSIIGNESDDVWVEALIVPGDTFGEYPLMRVFNWYQSQPTEFTITSNQPYVTEETDTPQNYSPPTLTIEKVELLYFVSNPYYQVNDPNYSKRSPYIQPVWHFRGHYDNGDEFDAVIQALQRQFLLPEIVPGITPG